MISHIFSSFPIRFSCVCINQLYPMNQLYSMNQLHGFRSFSNSSNPKHTKNTHGELRVAGSIAPAAIPLAPKRPVSELIANVNYALENHPSVAVVT